MRVPAPPPELAAGPRGIADLARRVLHGLFLHHTFDHAATMAFYFFLGTIPLMVVVGLLVGQVVERDGLSVVTAQLYEVLPGSPDSSSPRSCATSPRRRRPPSRRSACSDFSGSPPTASTT
jgi:hypothetical protein